MKKLASNPQSQLVEMILRTDNPGDSSIVTAASRAGDLVASRGTLIIAVGAAVGVVELEVKGTSRAAVVDRAFVTGPETSRLSLELSLAVGTDY